MLFVYFADLVPITQPFPYTEVAWLGFLLHVSYSHSLIDFYLEREVILGVEVVGLILDKSCWLFEADELDRLKSSFELPLRKL